MRKLDLILDRLKPINDTIPDLLPTARDRALDSMTALHITRDGYPKLYAENFTAGMRQIIAEHPIDNWDITDNPNGLHLIDDQTQMRIRFLKNFAFSGEIPPAGRNKARNEIWYQGSLDLGEQVSAKHPLSDVELIIVWTENAITVLLRRISAFGARQVPQRRSRDDGHVTRRVPQPA